MGFSYFGGKRWADITREERFFCQHLFTLLKEDSENRLLSHINEQSGTSFRLDVEWEPAFEVCLYRDLNHARGNRNHDYSRKRTFDLCMFSENAIVILEAKAQQSFEVSQVENFCTDRKHVKEITRVKCVWLGGLASSAYEPTDLVTRALDGRLVTWQALSRIFENDKVLARADELYDPDELKTWGKNNKGGYRTGSELMDLHERGTSLYVGRQGGLDGSDFCEDLQSGRWRIHRYETSSGDTSPNRNWFSLQEFAREVKRTQAKMES